MVQCKGNCLGNHLRHCIVAAIASPICVISIDIVIAMGLIAVAMVEVIGGEMHQHRLLSHRLFLTLYNGVSGQ